MKHFFIAVFLLSSFAYADEIKQPLHRLKLVSDYELSGAVKEVTEIYDDESLSSLYLQFNKQGYLVHKKWLNSEKHAALMGKLNAKNELYVFKDGLLFKHFSGYGDIELDESNSVSYSIVTSYTEDKKIEEIKTAEFAQSSSVIRKEFLHSLKYIYSGPSYKETSYSSNKRTFSKIYEFSNRKLITVLSINQQIEGVDNHPKLTEHDRYVYNDNRLKEVYKPFSKLVLKYNKEGHLSETAKHNLRINQVREMVVFSDYKYDDCGNWVERLETQKQYMEGDNKFLSLKQLKTSSVNNLQSEEPKWQSTDKRIKREIAYFKSCTGK